MAEQDMVARVVGLLNSNLGSSLTESDVTSAHRIPRMSVNPNNPASPTHPPPIIIQFTTKKSRNAILTKRKELKEKGISITEHLTVNKSNLLRQANDCVLKKTLESAWSHDGRILIRTLQNRIQTISTMADLESFRA